MAEVLKHSQFGLLIVEHFDSLPRWHEGSRLTRNAPWVGPFLVVPAGAAIGWTWVDQAPVDSGSVALMAGVAVLGGLLFEVLSSVSGRIAALADSIEGPATNEQLALVSRLDVARSNIAYCALVSILFVTELGLVTALRNPADWLGPVGVFLLLHLSSSLVLMLVRINSISRSDRVAALTADARRRSRVA